MKADIDIHSIIPYFSLDIMKRFLDSHNASVGAEKVSLEIIDDKVQNRVLNSNYV